MSDFVAIFNSAVTSTATSINLGSQSRVTALANGASYPYTVVGTKMYGTGIEYLSVTGDNGSGTITVVRGMYGSVPQSYIIGDGLYRETPRSQGTQSTTDNTASGLSASPTGNVANTEKAIGLGSVSGFTITPKSTGKIAIIIGGMALNSAAIGGTCTITGRYGTGTAPINGATSGLGTQFGTSQQFISSTIAGQQGFIVMGNITNLTIGQPIWFDLSLLGPASGGATVKNVQCLVWEY